MLSPLSPGDSLSARRGTVPAEHLLLPVGEYQRVITHERCTPYFDTVRVGATDRLPKRNLFCR